MRYLKTGQILIIKRCNTCNFMFKVRKVFDESGFMVTDQSVNIMDGIDEGLFSWFTINFLLSMFFLLEYLLL